MKCYNCGSKLHKESNYCHVCGTELSKEEKLLLNLEDSNNDESDNKSDNDKIINFDVLKYKLRRVFIESKDIPSAKESETETLGEIVDDDEVITELLENDDFQFNVNYNPSNVEEAAPVDEIESEEVEPSFFDKIKNKINSNSDIKESDTEDIQYYDSNAIDISKINTKTQEKPSFFNQFKSNRMDSEEIADEIIESDIENVELSNETPSDKEKGFFTTILSGLKSFINEDDEEYNFFELFSGKDSEIDEEGLSKSQLNEDVEPIDTALMKEEIIDDEELILSEDGFETNNENFIEEVTHQEDLSLEDIVVEDDFTNNESNDEHKQSWFKRFIDFVNDDEDDTYSFEESENVELCEFENKVIEEPIEIDLTMNKDNTTKYSRDEFDEALEESDDIENEFYDEDLENFVLTEMDFENSKEEDEDKISFTKQLTNITKKFAAGIRNFFSAIVSFFVNLFNSIKSFFVSNKGNDATMEDNDFVTEEDLDVVIKTDDTVNMVFTEEEMAKLNSHLDSEKDENVFRGLNEKVYPYIKKLLSMKSIIRIPLLFITLLMVAFPPAYVIKGSIPLVVFITIVKYIFAFVQIYYPITRAFKLSNIRLKRSVVTFFVIISMFINQLIGMIGFMLKPLTDSATTNLMLALSPTIIVSLITFVVSLFFILTIAYNHIKKNNILIFTGWFSVVYIAIALIIQLIYIILSALLSSFVLNLVI